MPGIVAIFTRNPNAHHVGAQLSTMLDSMLHESFYTCGTFSAPELGCYVGWASHEGSYSDCNPIVSPTREVALIFAGEHFGQPAEGRRRRNGQATASELLGLYEERGDAFVEDLNGWFTGVVINRRQRSAMLFNDRYGIHRVYYTEDKDSFLFASEAKALLAVSPDTRRLDDVALGQFLVFGNTLEHRTLFSNVHLMPGGSAWSFTGNLAPNKRRYFDPGVWESQATTTPDRFYADLKTTVSRVVPQYFRRARKLASR